MAERDDDAPADLLDISQLSLDQLEALDSTALGPAARRILREMHHPKQYKVTAFESSLGTYGATEGEY
jgi:FXSXX-COOH protein